MPKLFESVQLSQALLDECEQLDTASLSDALEATSNLAAHNIRQFRKRLSMSWMYRQSKSFQSQPH